MQTLDLKKNLKPLYQPSARDFSLISIPPMNFLMIDGSGNPNTAPEYAEAVNALYSVAYTLKFKIKKELAIDYPVMPLEGLWWMDDMRLFTAATKDEWKWTMMILQPDPITPALVAAAAAEAARKKDLPALPRLRLERYDEGRAAQILYFGPYADEGPTIQRLHAFIHIQGGELHGKHHEIYLGDPRRTAPEKLRTVIRQPMSQGGSN